MLYFIPWAALNNLEYLGRGCGQVVSLFAFYFGNPSSHPLQFYCAKIVRTERKINEKQSGIGPLKNIEENNLAYKRNGLGREPWFSG